jgi:hypothetical protein
LADQKRHLPVATLKLSPAPAKTFKVVQLRISAAKSHRNLCHNMPKYQERTWLCNALHNHSIACLDPLERFSDKRSFSLTCDPLQPTATRETFLAGSPQTRPSFSWLVGVSCRVRLRSCTMVSNPSAWSPTFFGKSQDGLTSADEPRTTKIINQVIPSSSMFKLSSMQIPSNSSLLVLTCRTCVSRQWLSASC